MLITNIGNLDIRMGTLIILLASSLLIYNVVLGVYRLWFHPLSNFPGSPWAALSRWYEVYWQIYRRGSLIFEIDRLHKIHGPIVRIGPNELHISSPDFHHEIFKPGSKFLKEKYHYDLFCMPKATTGIRDPKIIRTRKEVYKPLFDRKTLMAQWDSFYSKMNRLTAQLEATEDSIVVQDAMACFTLDVIAEIAFSQDFGAIETKNFKHPYLGVLHDSISNSWISKLFPSVRNTAIALEPVVRKRFAQTPTRRLLASVHTMIDEYLLQPKHDKKRLNAIDHFMNPKAARDYTVPDLETLNNELLAVLGGGTETTATAAAMGIYEIVTNSTILERLQQELDEHIPSRDAEPTWTELENIPYLAAIVKEIVRFSSPLPGRLPRIVPKGGVIVEGKYIPAGTVVGMSAYIMNRTENLFPDGHSFNPNRWLNIGGSGALGELDRYIITFSKGVGQCPGMNTAWAELYILIGTLFRRFNIELAEETKAEHMKWTDHVVIIFKGPSLRAKFTPRN